MRNIIFTMTVAASLLLAGCSSQEPFAEYQRLTIGKVAMGSSVTKEIVLTNPSTTEVQHISLLRFEVGYNKEGHFQIEKVEVGGVVKNPRDKDITVPPGSILQIYVKYQPLNLDTTMLDIGGWRTGYPERYEPGPPAPEESSDPSKVMAKMLSSKSAIEEEEVAIHRALIVIAYDHPGEGLIQMEVVGEATVGPNGERTAGGSSGGECPEGTGFLCYKGGFSMELPDIMNTGPRPLKMTGPAVFQLSGSNVSIDMGTFPAVLLVLKGNGPGEPLEGKPIGALSIVVSGVEGVTASGTFDGTNLDLNGVAFRIRVILGEITEADINPGLQATVDFGVKELTLTTKKPYTNGSISLSVETSLSQTPSGNAMFDQFLGGTRVNVLMEGEMEIR